MKYKLVTTHDGYSVTEKKTGLVIKTVESKDKAKEFRKLLETGTAFNGNTPPFFVKAVNG